MLLPNQTIRSANRLPVPAPRLRLEAPKVTRRSRGPTIALAGCAFIMVAAMAFVLRREQHAAAQCAQVTSSFALNQDGLSIAAVAEANPAVADEPVLRLRLHTLTPEDLAAAPTPNAERAVISLRGATRANSQAHLGQQALSGLTKDLTPRSPLYFIEPCPTTGNAPATASAVVHVAAPAGQNNLNTLDLYGWDAQTMQWRWLSGEVDVSSLSIRAKLEHLPSALLLAQSQSTRPIVAAELPPRDSNTGGTTLLLPSVIEEVSPYGLYLGDDGALVGTDSRMRLPQSYRVIPAIRNWNDAYTNRSLLRHLLDNPQARQNHIQHILNFMQASDRFTGIELDFRGLEPDQSELFEDFVGDLAQQLHARGRVLILGLPAPIQQEDGRWANSAYRIGPLAALVDVVKIDLSTAIANTEPDTLHSLLNWLMGQVSRNKLQIVTSALGVQRNAEALKFVPLNDSLSQLPPLTLTSAEAAPTTAHPGQVIRIELKANALDFNPRTRQWCFTHMAQTDAGAQAQEHETCLGTAERLRQVLAVLLQYQVRGITIRGLSLPGNDINLSQTLQDFSRQRIAAPSSSGLRFSLILQSPNGNIPVGEISPEQPSLSFVLPNRPGDYTVGLMANGVRLHSNAVTFIVAEPSKQATLAP